VAEQHALGIAGGAGRVIEGDRIPFVNRVLPRKTGIAAGEGSVWLTNAKEPEVVRLNGETGAVEARIPLGGFGEDVVLRLGLVWVVVPPSE